MSWTGRLLWVRVIQSWALASSGSGGTVVSCDEFLGGWGIAWLITSADLVETDRKWLTALKKASEKQPAF